VYAEFHLEDGLSSTSAYTFVYTVLVESKKYLRNTLAAVEWLLWACVNVGGVKPEIVTTNW